MQTTRREIDLFVAWKSFKCNDVIDSKIVNLNIWHHFQLLDELSQKLKLNSDLRLISSWVRRFDLSNQVESEDLTWVIKSSQNVNMKTQLDDQSNHSCSCFETLCDSNNYLIVWEVSIL